MKTLVLLVVCVLAVAAAGGIRDKRGGTPPATAAALTGAGPVRTARSPFFTNLFGGGRGSYDQGYSFGGNRGGYDQGSSSGLGGLSSLTSFLGKRRRRSTGTPPATAAALTGAGPVRTARSPFFTNLFGGGRGGYDQGYSFGGNRGGYDQGSSSGLGGLGGLSGLTSFLGKRRRRSTGTPPATAAALTGAGPVRTARSPFFTNLFGGGRGGYDQGSSFGGNRGGYDQGSSSGLGGLGGLSGLTSFLGKRRRRSTGTPPATAAALTGAGPVRTARSPFFTNLFGGGRGGYDQGSSFGGGRGGYDQGSSSGLGGLSGLTSFLGKRRRRSIGTPPATAGPLMEAGPVRTARSPFFTTLFGGGRGGYDQRSSSGLGGLGGLGGLTSFLG